ncbi:IclR family transcriptional regulator [Aeromicrobium wangtongii]|uniref:IclR family transcriptional regulator n=1 Tax=Aeromicrobium wangtongii TaxID=2969247 RepID=UPI00201777A4|nr:IclR family transcriptional regulator [Aeromicrobium wangtongii]MCL3818672.1 IclR family transcriptional regulator [Aeromicrobium wangtongii]
MASDDERSGVVQRVGAVLRGLGSFEPGGASTTGLARHVGLARATTHRLLTSLQVEGLVDRDRTSGRWHLGAEMYLLGNAAAARYDISDAARRVVHQLAETTGESAFLSAVRGDDTVCLLREDGSFPLRSHVLHEGIRFPLGVASAGLAILSMMTDREVDDYLTRVDLTGEWGPAHGAAALRERIAQTRLDGFATNPGLVVEGSWGLGAAVFDGHGRPAWALSLTGVETRFSSERRPQLGRLLLEAAHRLSTAVSSQ